jgi:hypothetical protein
VTAHYPNNQFAYRSGESGPHYRRNRAELPLCYYIGTAPSQGPGSPNPLKRATVPLICGTGNVAGMLHIVK